MYDKGKDFNVTYIFVIETGKKMHLFAHHHKHKEDKQENTC